ncbi:MAG: NAD-dependent epimerase/dehydratase family protein, partial [Lachnospiraceae bacterium]|nr:NAD-dependent epimerase/dehydratase family protein [Lachnospiraceae bacterium]
MNIAIAGSSGYIAGFLVDSFKNKPEINRILKIGRTKSDIILDLAEPARFDYSSLDNIDYVIFTAAISGPDQCAEKFDLCWHVNVDGTAFFISEAVKRRCKILFFSSDAVFGNIPGKIYTEESETVPLTPYGRMKPAGENKLINSEY